jgi:addiction module RelE/StbE family toxin
VRLLWSPRALSDRTAIFDYIDADNPQPAARLDAKFVQAAERLRRHPEIGRPGRLEGTRELVVHPSYILVYIVEDETVGVVPVIHTSREWPVAE